MFFKKLFQKILVSIELKISNLLFFSNVFLSNWKLNVFKNTKLKIEILSFLNVFQSNWKLLKMCKKFKFSKMQIFFSGRGVSSHESLLRPRKAFWRHGKDPYGKGPWVRAIWGKEKNAQLKESVLLQPSTFNACSQSTSVWLSLLKTFQWRSNKNFWNWKVRDLKCNEKTKNVENMIFLNEF